MTKFEDVLETILEEYARRDSEGEFDTWEETDAFVKEKAEVLLAYVKEYPVSEDLEEAMQHNAPDNIGIDDLLYWRNGFITGAKCQKEKDESTTEDLGNYINELSNQFPEVSFAKLSRIAVRVAKWQKEQFEKERLKHCDELTEEQAQMESDFVVQHLKKNNRTPTFIDAIEYGMRLQKEQMMADAIDAEVKVDAGGYPYIDKTIELYDYDKDVPLAKEGEKYKVVLIKED